MASPVPIGGRIVQARRAAKLSQAQLAAKSGYGIRSITGWENDKFHPSITALARIAVVTGRTVAWFYETEAEAA